ncbi:hypothetical protein Patl1_35454 [Pistacia atlantica]|nr:hypothetical protein Patl1_35454 [Pistacia atlantica]
MMENRKILNTGDLDGFDKRKLPSLGFQVEVVLVAGVGPQAQPSPLLSPVHNPVVSQATRWDLLDIESSAGTHLAPEQVSTLAVAELETP